MHSETLFVWLASPTVWMFVRNVRDVDGRAVPDSAERLDRLFTNPTIDTVAYLHQLQQENARFDIGPVARTLGDPTFALRYLEPNTQVRFAFTRAGTERVRGAVATKLAYRERRRPFVVKVDGADAPSSGTMWIDADGAVLRTQLQVSYPTGRGAAASVTVDFQKDLRLGTWVPWRMVEQYTGSGELVTGTASYANFRKFDTSIRVVVP
jgi:hypothetical protein